MTGSRTALVITTIASPNAALKSFAEGCRREGIDFIVVGDVQTPEFALDGCRYFSVAAQRATGFRFAQSCPERHYARKNIGYLLAMQAGAEVLLESDDDNLPRDTFWARRSRRVQSAQLDRAGWANVYSYFTDVPVWPRGLPLDLARNAPPAFDSLPAGESDCPIQQGLADDNPDVDAIYRLLFPLPIQFRRDRRVSFGPGTWCPFNSQNTAWWRDAFPLLYLPSYCSLRATDIWRGLIAQRVAWANGWAVLFDAPTVYQERNEHDLMRDFRDEVAVYLRNREIARTLEALDLPAGVDSVASNLRRCYEALVGIGVMGERELSLLDDWIADVESVTTPRAHSTSR